MKIIDVYLAHRDSTKFLISQTKLIKKYFKCNEGSKINIYGYVDGYHENIKNDMRRIWLENGVTPIEIPNIIDGQDRNYLGAGHSFGLAFTYVYQNYILKNNNISVCLENDVFPFKDINIEEYVNNYEICGEVRFNAAQLPDRNVMFWLGFIIFNGEKMNDRELFSGLLKPIVNIESGRTHTIDCGGQSYYWIKKTNRNIRQMVTNGNEQYDGFISLECTPHNITHDIECLPEVFRENYHPSYRVLVYDNCLIHLERMGKEHDHGKELWWDRCFNKIIQEKPIYIPIGFQCTTAEILKKKNKRICSFPFDWMISNPESINKLFDILLKKDCNIEEFVKNEFFKIDKNLYFVKAEEFIIHPQGDILFNSKYNLIFPHFKNDNETILKMIKRFERLRNYILNSDNILNFIFVNRLINNDLKIVNENTLKFSINNNNIFLNIKENIINLNNLLSNYIHNNRYKIIVVTAVHEINNNNNIGNNITYHEIVPSNSSNLTDEEIIPFIHMDN